MNNYITLDSKKYFTHGKSWHPEPITPQTVRVMLNGNLDVTYGAGSLQIWVGEIEGHVTSPGSGYGTIADLRTSLLKKQTLSFTDHYGTTYTVAAQGPFAERSLSVKWDGTGNVIFVKTRLIAKV